MQYVATQLFNGIVYSMLLFITAAGIALIFGVMNVIPLVQGSFFMLGGFVALSVVRATGNFWLALVLAPIPSILLAIAIERFALRKFYQRGHLDQALLTFGFAYIILDLTGWIWGTEVRHIAQPAVLSGVLRFGDLFMPVYRIAVVVLGALMAAGLWLTIDRSRYGALIRATVDDRTTAQAIGINVPLISAVVFAVGSALAAFAGVVAAPILGIYPGIDTDILIPVLMVVVIGGLDSLRGALAGSLLLGLAETFTKAYLPGMAMFVLSGTMVVVLLFRPVGLFGTRRPE